MIDACNFSKTRNFVKQNVSVSNKQNSKIAVFINNNNLFIFALTLFTKHCNPIVNTFCTNTPKLVPREFCDVRNIHQTPIKNLEILVSL